MSTQTLISEVENFRRDILLSSLETEFANCGDEERKSNISEMIDEIRNRKKILDTTGKNQKNEIFEKIDEMTLSQPWNKIPEKKRLMLIDNYIHELEPDNKVSRDQLSVTLSNENLTIKYVNYDTKNRKIISINNLVKNDDDLYTFNNTKSKKTKKKTEIVESDDEEEIIVKPKKSPRTKKATSKK